MKVALLDVNVLLALAWRNHQHHGIAQDWFARDARHGWATCGVTQTSFVRISSNPAFTKYAVSPAEAAGLLAELTNKGRHQFWDSPAAGDPSIFEKALGHQQVMDAWLVATAEKNHGRFVTFDSRTAMHGSGAGAVYVLGT